MYEDTKLMLEYAKVKEAKAAIKQDKERRAAIAEAADRDAIWDKLSSRNDDTSDFLSFKQKVTDAYVIEALTMLVDNCLNPVLVKEEYHQKLVRQLVTNFVNEEGSSKLLRKFKGTSYLMSEMAYAIETTIESIIETSKKSDGDNFKQDKKETDKFYEKLEKVDVDEAVKTIASRVQEQERDFMEGNMKEKAALTASLDKTKQKVAENKSKLEEKVNDAKAQEKAAKLEEAYISEGKRRIADIRASRSKNVFECMVFNLSKLAMVNESASKFFVEDSKLSMDKIVEHCETICTFLTTLDSLKIVDVNESYIEKMLNSMK